MSIQMQMALAKLFAEPARPDPYPLLATLREGSPCVLPAVQTVVVGRWEHTSALLRDRTLSSERPDSPTFFSQDPPVHTRLRGLTSRAFTSALVDAQEPVIRRICHELLDGAAGADDLDLAQQLSYPLTGRVICAMFDLPAEDVEVFRDWTRLLTAGIDPQMFPDPEFDAEVRQARKAFEEYFRPFVEARRRDPGDDLVSRLVHVRDDDGDGLDDQELVETCVLLAVAAHENPVGLIGNTVLALLRHPEALAAVWADPSLAGEAVEETLRYDSPAQLTGRMLQERTTVGDVELPAGYLVLLLLAAANRDPEKFPDPDRFDLGRSTTGHLAYAAGPHYCMGADLARLEARVAVEVLAERLGSPELVPDSLVYKPNVSIRGPLRMRVAGTLAPAGRG